MADNNNSLEEQACSHNFMIYIHKKYQSPSAFQQPVNGAERQCSSVPLDSNISDDQNHRAESSASTASAILSDLPTGNTSTCSSFPLPFQNAVHNDNDKNKKMTLVPQAIHSQRSAIPSFTSSTVPFRQSVIHYASKNHPDSSSMKQFTIDDDENIVFDGQQNRKCDVKGNYDLDMIVSQRMIPEYSLISSSTPPTTTLNMENELISSVSQEDTPVTYGTLCKLQPTFAAVTPEISNFSMCGISELPHTLLYVNPGHILPLYDSRHRQSSYTVAKLADKPTSTYCDKTFTGTGHNLKRKRYLEVSDLIETKSSYENSGDHNYVCNKKVCSSDRDAEYFEAAYSLLSLNESFTPCASINFDHAPSIHNVMTNSLNIERSDIIEMTSNFNSSQKVCNIGNTKKMEKKVKTTVSKKGKVISQLENSLVHHLSLDNNESMSFSTSPACHMELMTGITSTTVPVCQTESLTDTAFSHQQYTGISVAKTAHDNSCIQKSFQTSETLPVDENVTIQNVKLEVGNFEENSDKISSLDEIISQAPIIKVPAPTNTPNTDVLKKSKILDEKIRAKPDMSSVACVCNAGAKSAADVFNIQDSKTEDSLMNPGSGPVLCPNATVGDNFLPQNSGAKKKVRIKLMAGKTYVMLPCDDSSTTIDVLNIIPIPNKKTTRKSKIKGLKSSSKDLLHAYQTHALRRGYLTPVSCIS